MRKTLSLLAFLICTPAMADDLWKLNISIIAPGGNYRKYTTGGVVSYDECKMRAEMWKRKYLPGLEVGMQYWADEGKPASIKIECVPEPLVVR